MSTLDILGRLRDTTAYSPANGVDILATVFITAKATDTIQKSN